MFRGSRRKGGGGIVIRQRLRSCNRVTSLSIPQSSPCHGLQLLSGRLPCSSFTFTCFTARGGRRWGMGRLPRQDIQLLFRQGKHNIFLGRGNAIFANGQHCRRGTQIAIRGWWGCGGVGGGGGLKVRPWSDRSYKGVTAAYKFKWASHVMRVLQLCMACSVRSD